MVACRDVVAQGSLGSRDFDDDHPSALVVATADGLPGQHGRPGIHHEGTCVTVEPVGRCQSQVECRPELLEVRGSGLGANSDAEEVWGVGSGQRNPRRPWSISPTGMCGIGRPVGRRLLTDLEESAPTLESLGDNEVFE